MDNIYETDENQYYSESGSSLFDWLKSPACIVLCIFIFGTMIFIGKGQQQAAGMLLVLLFSLTVMMRGTGSISPVPPEIKMYIAWILWAALTGPMVAVNKAGLWYGGLRQVLQVLVLVIAVYGMARMHKERALKAAMFGIIIGGILQAMVVRGAVQTMGGGLSGLEGESGRVGGLASNVNTLGFMMIWALLAAIMLWKQKWGKTHKLVLAGTALLLPILSYGMLASGSRKSLVAFAFVIAAWFWYAMAPRNRTKAVAWKTGVFVTILALSGPLSVYVLTNTLAGKRMAERLTGGGTLVTSERGRLEMYLEGFKMTAKSPIVGVGINQYRDRSSSGKYSHSNYIEPLATTGIPGFILYQGIFFIPLYRAWRLTKMTDDTAQIYQLKVIVIMCVTILLLGFGSPWYSSTMV
ncbi:MAG: hypothetical protein DRP56_04320, partial [Planctomycetota bacterium]